MFADWMTWHVGRFSSETSTPFIGDYYIIRDISWPFLGSYHFFEAVHLSNQCSYNPGSVSSAQVYLRGVYRLTVDTPCVGQLEAVKTSMVCNSNLANVAVSEMSLHTCIMSHHLLYNWTVGHQLPVSLRLLIAIQSPISYQTCMLYVSMYSCCSVLELLYSYSIIYF